MPVTIEFLKVLTSLAWPAILAVLLWRLFPVLKVVIVSRSFSVKVAGMELSIQDATEQIRTQIEDLQKQVINLRTGGLGDTTEPTSNGQTGTQPAQKFRPRVLWVDDKPTNNALEIAQLNGLGIDVVQSISTEDAMTTLNSNSGYYAIISDMGRREQGIYHSQAGLVLLSAVRRAGYHIPFLVYSSQKYASRQPRGNQARRRRWGDSFPRGTVGMGMAGGQSRDQNFRLRHCLTLMPDGQVKRAT
jgi:hypothetical protein